MPSRYRHSICYVSKYQSTSNSLWNITLFPRTYAYPPVSTSAPPQLTITLALIDSQNICFSPSTYLRSAKSPPANPMQPVSTISIPRIPLKNPSVPMVPHMPRPQAQSQANASPLHHRKSHSRGRAGIFILKPPHPPMGRSMAL